MLTKTQFSLVGAFSGYVGPDSRISLQGNCGLLYNVVLISFLFFHIYNICGYTSSSVCLQTEIIEGLLKYKMSVPPDQTMKTKQETFNNFNATEFFDTESDIFVVRINADSPMKMLTKKSKDQGAGSSSFSHQMVYFGPSGEVLQYKGHASDLKEHENRRILKDQSKKEKIIGHDKAFDFHKENT